jgi:hypothetical protein
MPRPEGGSLSAALLLGVLVLVAAVASAQTPEALPAPTPPVPDGQVSAVPPNQTPSAEPTASPSQSIYALEAIEIGGVESRTAALLLSGQTGGNLPGVMLLCQEAEASDDGLVPLRLYLELDGGGLLEAAPNDRVPIAVYVYVLSEQGSVEGHLAEGVIVRDPAIRAAMHRSGLKFEGRVAVPPGTVSVRAMVRVYGTDHFLLTRSEVRLLAAGSGLVSRRCSSRIRRSAGSGCASTDFRSEDASTVWFRPRCQCSTSPVRWPSSLLVTAGRRELGSSSGSLTRTDARSKSRNSTWPHHRREVSRLRGPRTGRSSRLTSRRASTG